MNIRRCSCSALLFTETSCLEVWGKGMGYGKVLRQCCHLDAVLSLAQYSLETAMDSQRSAPLGEQRAATYDPLDFPPPLPAILAERNHAIREKGGRRVSSDETMGFAREMDKTNYR